MRTGGAPMTFASTTSHAARGRLKTVGSRLMKEIRVGDLVAYEGRVLRVRGFSPMSASPRRVLLEDVDTGEDVEAPLDDLEPHDDGGPVS